MEQSASKFSRAPIERVAPYPAVEFQVPMMQYLMHRNDPRQPGLKLTLDVHDFEQFTTVAVMPYDGMKENDEVEVFFQAFIIAGQPIGRLPKMAKILKAEDVGKPVTFPLMREDLLAPENLVGFYADFYFTVTPENSEPLKSITQSVQLLLADPAPERLETPSFEEGVGAVLYPQDHPNGVTLKSPAYPDIQFNDIVVLFESTGGVADWQFVDADGQSELQFTLSQAWLKANVDKKNISLQMHYGRANRGLRSLPLPVRVSNDRAIDEAPELHPTLTFYSARAGLAVTIPENADISGGSTTMRIVDADNVPLLSTDVFKEINGRQVFTFAPGTLDVILGVNAKVYFVHVSPEGISVVSKSSDLSISLPGSEDQKYMPRLQCLQAQGIDELPKSLSDVEIELGGWPLMAEGQRVRVILHPEEGTPALVMDQLVTAEHLESKSFKASFPSSHLSGKKVRLATTLHFNVSEKEPDGKGSAMLQDLTLPLKQ